MKKLIALLICLAIFGCIKKPATDENEILTNAEEVTEKLSTAWVSEESTAEGLNLTDPLTMKTGQFVAYDSDQQIESSEPRVVLQEGITLVQVDAETDPKDIIYKFAYQTLAAGQNSPLSREQERRVTKPTSAVTSALKATEMLKPLNEEPQMSLGFEKLVNLVYACQESEELQVYCKEKLKADSCQIICSNLKTTSSSIPALPEIASQPNCLNLPDCKMRIEKIEFDWSFKLVRGEETQKQKLHYTIAIAKDFPFLARVYSNCVRGLVTTNDGSTKVLVNQCSTLRKYQP